MDPSGREIWEQRSCIRCANNRICDATEADAPAPLPDYSDDGVDLSLIRWMLSLTPLQRLQFLQDRTNDILAIRERNARK